MERENKVMNLLAAAWNAWNDVADDPDKTVHPDDEADFRKAIHDAQRIVATVRCRDTSPELFK
ncbi:hypothetical protein [Mucilaginibacter glaciei]|uniref:Uncharacterized protein n=1 Tax=Mucilaginibacter glaciei TaxID=2772109 RepID=A0A926S2W1_9SPHI|nr:hypothetical protein [Mucilaginibacter glaciei]MBD1394287.1 hypothetical protein [Mucilaginibacter glaciei]